MLDRNYSDAIVSALQFGVRDDAARYRVTRTGSPIGRVIVLLDDSPHPRAAATATYLRAVRDAAQAGDIDALQVLENVRGAYREGNPWR